jgi:hypothetical protein
LGIPTHYYLAQHQLAEIRYILARTFPTASDYFKAHFTIQKYNHKFAGLRRPRRMITSSEDGQHEVFTDVAPKV